MKIYGNILELIGSTPMVELLRFCEKNGCVGRIAAKLEGRNPAGSAKDRVGLAMLEAAECEGKLRAGGTVIEPTSGNTGIGLALAALVKGYKVILTMPETMSVERRKLLAAYGAELVLTEGAKGMAGAIEKAHEIAEQTENSYLAGQFVNPANPQIHYRTTGPEIWQDTDGSVAAIVAGVGTGGTLCGSGKYLKEKNPDIKIIAVEPQDSPVLSGGKAGTHGLQGIGAGFIPETTDVSLFDEIITVTTEQAVQTCRELVECEGILAGISGGAALYAAMQAAKREEFKNALIAVILPDSGERYMSMGIFG